MEPIEVKGESQKNNWKLHQQRPFKKCSREKKKSLKSQTIVSWKHRNKSSKGEWSGSATIMIRNSKWKNESHKRMKGGKLDTETMQLIRKEYLRKAPPSVSVWGTVNSEGNAIHSFTACTCSTIQVKTNWYFWEGFTPLQFKVSESAISRDSCYNISVPLMFHLSSGQSNGFH